MWQTQTSAAPVILTIFMLELGIKEKVYEEPLLRRTTLCFFHRSCQNWFDANEDWNRMWKRHSKVRWNSPESRSLKQLYNCVTYLHGFPVCNSMRVLCVCVCVGGVRCPDYYYFLTSTSYQCANRVKHPLSCWWLNTEHISIPVAPWLHDDREHNTLSHLSLGNKPSCPPTHQKNTSSTTSLIV